jgi:hypothetical protein
MSEAITIQESADLVRLEKTIAQGLQTFVEVGEALVEIRDRNLYRIEHATFADYCKVKWSMSDRRARQLMGASEVVGDIAKSGTTVPKTERQARPLTKLPPEKRAEAWQEAVEASPGGKPTAKAVAAVVAQRTGTPAKAEDDKPPLQWVTHYWQLCSDEEHRLFDNFRASWRRAQ